MLKVNDVIEIDERQLEETFIHSPGPGGQHVNKAATGVQLRFDIQNSPALPEDVRQRLIRLAGKRLTKQGVLIIEVHSHRSLERNRQEARQRLLRLIRRATQAPKKRLKTRMPRNAVERRLELKRRQSEKKQRRRPPDV